MPQLNRIWNHWSESKLKLLDLCPLAFKLAYIERRRVPQSAEKVFGSAIHYMAKRFFVLKNGYQSVDSFGRAFIGFWQGVLQGEHGPAGYLDPPIQIRYRNTDRQNYIGLGISLLCKFYEENRPYRDGTWSKPKNVEKKYSFPFQGYRLMTVVDRTQPLPEGGDVIYDYKTGFSLRSEIELQFDVQFTFHSLAYRVRFGIPPAKMALWFLRPEGGKIVEVPARTSDHFIDLAGKLEEACHFVHGVLIPPDKTCLLTQATYRYFCFPPLPPPHFFRIVGGHCRWCDYDEVCGQYKSIDPSRDQQVIRELQGIQPPDEVVQLTFEGFDVQPKKHRME